MTSWLYILKIFVKRIEMVESINAKTKLNGTMVKQIKCIIPNPQKYIKRNMHYNPFDFTIYFFLATIMTIPNSPLSKQFDVSW